METIPENVAEAIKVIAGYLKESTEGWQASIIVFEDSSSRLYTDFDGWIDSQKGGRYDIQLDKDNRELIKVRDKGGIR